MTARSRWIWMTNGFVCFDVFPTMIHHCICSLWFAGWEALGNGDWAGVVLEEGHIILFYYCVTDHKTAGCMRHFCIMMSLNQYAFTTCALTQMTNVHAISSISLWSRKFQLMASTTMFKISSVDLSALAGSLATDCHVSPCFGSVAMHLARSSLFFSCSRIY